MFVTGRVEQHTSPGDGDSPSLADSGGRLLAIIRPSNFVPRALFSSSSHQHGALYWREQRSLGLRDLRDLHMRSGQSGSWRFVFDYFFNYFLSFNRS